MKKSKTINIILLNLSILFYYISYQLEYIFLYTYIPKTGFLGGKVSVILICDICITLAIVILLVVIILILTLEKNKLKVLRIIEILLISLTMLSYFGSHLLEALSFYMTMCCILGITIPINTVCNICFILSIFIPLIVMCLIIFEKNNKIKNKIKIKEELKWER